MKIISHRGNLNGPNLKKENTKEYIQNAIFEGFYVEVDVINITQDLLIVGHNSEKPSDHINLGWLNNYGGYCIFHAKTEQALNRLLELKYHCFFHKNDDFTLTSEGLIWVHPKAEVNACDERAIFCMPEEREQDLYMPIGGVCTDYPIHYRKRLVLPIPPKRKQEKLRSK